MLLTKATRYVFCIVPFHVRFVLVRIYIWYVRIQIRTQNIQMTLSTHVCMSQYICHCQDTCVHSWHVRTCICVHCHIRIHIYMRVRIYNWLVSTHVCMSQYICRCQDTYAHSIQNMRVCNVMSEHIYTCVSQYISDMPRTEEIRCKIFGSPDLTFLSLNLVSDGDSIYTTEKSCEILGTPVRKFLICMGTSVKTCWKFWQS